MPCLHDNGMLVQRIPIPREGLHMHNKRQDQDRWLAYGYWRVSREFRPPTDIIELEDKIVVMVEIAALRPQDLSITLQAQSLMIAGRRDRPAFPTQDGGAAYHQVEIGYGEFRIEIALPWAVQRDNVTAAYRDGLLQVELPRQSARQIAVRDTTEGEANA